MSKRKISNGAAIILMSLVLSSAAQAQLLECTQADISATVIANGCIAKSLGEQIGSGQGDDFLFGSSTFLIKRDPARSIRRGRQLFQRKFSAQEGLGPRVDYSSIGDVTESRALGAGLTDSCAACHGRPKGAAGFGGDVVTRPDSRDAPHLFGLGLVEQLADEMTAELRRLRSSALKRSHASGQPEQVSLVAKGVSFGQLEVFPDGHIDTSNVEGIDPDLRLRPFFHHGQTVSMREFVIGAFKDEMGLQAWDPILCAVTDPADPKRMISPAGFVYDPALDNFERPPVCDADGDADADGVYAEINPALVDHLEFYLLNYFKPGTYRRSRETDRGRRLLRDIGCVGCHKQDLRIDRDRRIADVETGYDPQKGLFNDLFAVAQTRFDVVEDSHEYPLIVPQQQAFTVRNFYSDLKRHDLGPAFHERDYDGRMVTHFVTEPLWGVGSSAPYGHDGRSINLDAVIRRHGGEATQSTRRYVELTERERQQLLSYLQTLVLFPPDDTASNLNPGVPDNRADIQNPATHGSINLGELFQIAEEGPE